MAVIDNEEMVECIVEDLVENYEYSQEKAYVSARKYSDSLQDKMWDEYSFQLGWLVEQEEGE